MALPSSPGKRPASFYALGAFFLLFVAFLYGPTVTIVILSFQGPDGGLTFPMQGMSTRWFASLFETQMVGDFGGSFTRSLELGLIVMAITVVVALAAGLGLSPAFRGATVLFYLAVASPDRALDPDQPGHRPDVPALGLAARRYSSALAPI